MLGIIEQALPLDMHVPDAIVVERLVAVWIRLLSESQAVERIPIDADVLRQRSQEVCCLGGGSAVLRVLVFDQHAKSFFLRQDGHLSDNIADTGEDRIGIFHARESKDAYLGAVEGVAGAETKAQVVQTVVKLRLLSGDALLTRGGSFGRFAHGLGARKAKLEKRRIEKTDPDSGALEFVGGLLELVRIERVIADRLSPQWSRHIAEGEPLQAVGMSEFDGLGWRAGDLVRDGADAGG